MKTPTMALGLSSLTIYALAILGACDARAQLTVDGKLRADDTLEAFSARLSSSFLQDFGNSSDFPVGEFAARPAQFSLGTYSVSIDSADKDSLWITDPTGNAGSAAMSTVNPNQPLQITFAGNVSAVGGNLFLTSDTEASITDGRTFRLSFTLSDGSTPTWDITTSSSNSKPFWGFTTTAAGTYITSLTIGVAGPGDSFATLDNLQVGSVSAVPEPSEWGLCLGMVGLAFAGVRRWRGSR
jgi:hypothetical protein